MSMVDIIISILVLILMYLVVDIIKMSKELNSNNSPNRKS